MQLDWTHTDELSIIQDVPFDHLLSRAVLRYSNVQHASPYRCESTRSLRTT